jgi:hypothetical protein
VVWHLETFHPDTVVGHAVMDVETLWWAKVVAPVEALGQW